MYASTKSFTQTHVHTQTYTRTHTKSDRILFQSPRACRAGQRQRQHQMVNVANKKISPFLDGNEEKFFFRCFVNFCIISIEFLLVFSLPSSRLIAVVVVIVSSAFSVYDSCKYYKIIFIPIICSSKCSKLRASTKTPLNILDFELLIRMFFFLLSSNKMK